MGEAILGTTAIIKICKETIWGVTPTTTPAPIWHKVAIKPGGGFKPNINKITNDLIGGDPNPRESLLGNQKAGGNLTLYASWDFLPYVMEMILGSRTSTGAATPWTQTSKIQAVSLPSYSIAEILDMATDMAIVTTGCRVNTAKISVASEGFMQIDLALVGKATTYSTTMPTAGTLVDNSDDTLITQADLVAASITFSAGAVAYIKSGSIDVNNNLTQDDYRAGGLGVLFSIPRKRATVTASFDCAWTEEASTKMAAVLTAPNTSVPVSLKWDGGTPEVTIALPAAKLTPDLPVINDGPLAATFAFDAFYEPTATSAIVSTVINEIDPATY
jgi:hypothetical protein